MMADDLGAMVGRARAYARGAHAGDVRKGTGRSYFDAHLAEVAEIVRSNGGTDEQIAAAFLHDVAEDHGGTARLADVRDEFGDAVADIVRDLSDSLVDTEAGEVKADWRTRKEGYVASLAHKAIASLEVAAADKLHNATSIVRDLATEDHDAFWKRFSTSDPAEHCWYYRSLADAIIARLPDHPTALALEAKVTELEAAVDSAGGRAEGGDGAGQDHA
ncbi:HD domain-containing protein [Actinospongicola halichondriae]|uniref:HD domain-containing protein n=1 Tax=Actinospongicola halichondriae TaxID=3236844 RepID=UPI003D3B599A